MTATQTSTDAVLAAAAAVIPTLPAASLTVGQALEGMDALPQALAVPGSKAVAASLAGDASGAIVLVVSPEIATQVENGPLGAQELVAALTPALDDAVAALAPSLGSIRHEAGQGLDAELALSSAGSYASVTVVQLLSGDAPAGALVVLLDDTTTAAASFETFADGAPAGAGIRGVELLSDVEMGVTAELGRTRMTVRELLSLQPGSVVELDRAAGSPVDLLVNGTLVARGEVVVIDEEFGVRITEIVGYDPKKQK